MGWGAVWRRRSEDGGGMSLRNVGIDLQVFNDITNRKTAIEIRKRMAATITDRCIVLAINHDNST